MKLGLFEIDENMAVTVKVGDIIAAARRDWYSKHGGAEGCDPAPDYYSKYLTRFLSKYCPNG